MNRPQRHSHFPVTWVYCALAALFFAPHLLGLSAFTDGDFTRHYLPYSFFQQNALLTGHLPVWNPHVNSGHPFLADTESAVFYPVSNILLLLTWFSPSVVGRLYWLQVEALVHIILACSFTALLVHRLTGRRMAGFAAGLVFGFSGYLTGYPPLQLGILRVAVWLPLILWLLLPTETGKLQWRRWLMACGVHAVAFFANHPQTFLFLTYAVGGWMLMLAVRQLHRNPTEDEGDLPRRTSTSLDSRRLLQHLGMTTAYGGILICLTVSQLWPALEFTRLSVRSARPFHELSSGFPPQDLWQFLLPGVMTYFSPLYFGIAGLGLALIAVAAVLSSRIRLAVDSPFARSAAIFFVITSVLAILVSFGDQLPLYPLLYRFAPGWSLFRGQERVAYLVAFSLSVLSGYGLAVLPSFAARWRQKFGWGFLAVVVVAMALVFIVWQVPGRLEVTGTRFLFHAGKSLLLATAFAFLCSAMRLSRTHLVLLLFVVVFDLFLTNFATNLVAGQEIRSSLTQPEIAATFQAADDLADETTSLPPRVYNERRLPEDSGMIAGWEDVWAASVLRLSAYNGFFVNFPPEKMWELTGVGTVLTWREELPVASHLLEEFTDQDETTRLHRLKTVSPRLWWTQNARSVDDKTALELLADPSFDPQKVLLVARSDADAIGNDWEDERIAFGNGGAASIEVERIGTTHLDVQIESDQPGLLFISENYMPGWQAKWTEENQQSQAASLPIARAHQAFLGIPVPAGSGTLELAYRPTSLRWGLAISGVSWIALLLVLRNQLAQLLKLAWGRVRSIAREIRHIDPSNLTMGKEHYEKGPDTKEDVRFAEKATLADRHWQRAAILLAVLIGFALRFYRLDVQELSFREAFLILESQLSFVEFFELFGGLKQPPFVASFWLHHVWYGLAGNSEFALRSISALAGSLAVPLVYRFAKEIRLSASATLMATFLTALSSYAISSSQDILLYPFSLSLTIASAISALKLIGGGRTKAIFVAYVLLSAATVYTHVFAVLALLAQNLYVLYLMLRDWHSGGNSIAQPQTRSLLLRWLMAQFAIAALCTPWLISAWSGTFEYGGNSDASSLAEALWWRFASYPIGFFATDKIWLLSAGLFGVAIIGAAVVGAFLAWRREKDQGERGAEDWIKVEQQHASKAREAQSPFRGHSYTVLLLLYLLVSPLAYWGPLFQKWSLFGSFYALTLPPFLLLLTIGLANIRDWIERCLGWRWRIWTDDANTDGPTVLNKIRVGSVAAVSLFLVIVAGNLFTLRNYHFEPEFSRSRGLRELSVILERWSAGLNPAEVHFIQSFPDPTFFAYYSPESVEHTVLPPAPQDFEGALEVVHELREVGVKRIILPVSLDQDQEASDIARQALSSSYKLAAQDTVGPWLVELYARPDPQQWRLFDVEFANDLTLERALVSPDFPPAGGWLVVHLDWSGAPQTMTGGEKLFLHLLDESGNLVAQWDPDFQLVSSKVSISIGMPIPPNLPAGPLSLIVGLYDVNMEGAPRILTETRDDSLLLVYFEEIQCDGCGR